MKFSFRNITLAAISGLLAGLLGMVINLKFGANTGTFLGLAVLMFLRPVGTAPRAIQIAGTVVGSSLVSRLYITANYWPGVLLLCSPFWAFVLGIWFLEWVQPRQQRPKTWAIAALHLTGFVIGAVGMKLGSLAESLGLVFIFLVGIYYQDFAISMGATLSFLGGYLAIGSAGLKLLIEMPRACWAGYRFFLVQVIMAVIISFWRPYLSADR